MTELIDDVHDLFSRPATITAERLPAGSVNPYASPGDAEPRTDFYAALREDADAREQEESALAAVSALRIGPVPPMEAPVASPVTDQPPVPEAPVLSAPTEAAEIEPERAPTTPTGLATQVMSLAIADTFSDFTGTDFTGTDFTADEADTASREDGADLTQVFAGLDRIDSPPAVWRRGDDDVIGTGTASRSTRRRSLRARRRAA